MPELSRRRLRAPSADGFALIDPPLSQAEALIERNREIGNRFDATATFPTFYRAIARRRLLAGTVGRLGPGKLDSRLPLILSGHQPELFHPGVWFKSFLLDAVAKLASGSGVNLVIDNDLCRSTSISVPAGPFSSPRVESVPYDAASPLTPWEARPILDRDILKRFSQEVRKRFGPFTHGRSYRPGLLVDQLWSHVVDSLESERARSQQKLRLAEESGLAVPKTWARERESLSRHTNLGFTMADGRVRLEQELGLQTTIRSLGDVCSDGQFIMFAELLLRRHAELHDIYNQALAEYRTINHIRDVSRPVPDLVRDGEWYECPFWICSHEDGHRRRAFVRRTSNRWELTDRQGSIWEPPLNLRDDLLGWLRATEFYDGIYLRPRALITTMYARLVLSDLFIHGIGGAKYDEVTDLIIRRFFGIEPPAYFTATATFRLPIERPQVSLDDIRDSARRIRETRFRPEAFVRDPLVTGEPDIAQKLAALADEKREYLAQHDLRRCAQHVFDRLNRLNRAMHELLAPVERELRAQHAELLTDLKHAQLLGSREFSFVLFPSEILPARLLDLCKVPS